MENIYQQDFKKYQPIGTSEWEHMFNDLISTLSIDIVGLTHSEVFFDVPY